MRVFITGITGTLGSALASLHHSRGDAVWGCARSEPRAVEWVREHARTATFFLTDARSLSFPHTDVGRLLPNIDRLYHCAAMKHVDLCEAQPAQALKQNVELTDTVARACRLHQVGMIHVSSDKACLPGGVYGATKLLAERVALREGAAVVRLGNLIGSSGSVFALWGEAVRRGERVRLTHPSMTRYFMGTAEAARFLADEAFGFKAGRVLIPKPLKAVVMGDVANAVGGPNVEVTGLRAGETMHQWLVAPGERYAAYVGRIELGEGADPSELGLCSATADRWDVGELLALAGMGRGMR